MKMDFANFFKILSAWPGFAAAVKAIEAIIQAGLEALVTKTDLRDSTDKLRGEMKAIEAAIRSSGEASVTKTDLTASTSELRGEMNELRGEMKAMAAELRGEISAAVNKMLLAQLAIAWVPVCGAMDFGVGGFRIARHGPRHPQPKPLGSKRREGHPRGLLRGFLLSSHPVVLPDPRSTSGQAATSSLNLHTLKGSSSDSDSAGSVCFHRIHRHYYMSHILLTCS